ncbi:MAG TPA: TIGR03621 family F420-dependent LLM class oxidoreductase, partial [Ktedonobacteraceae bacterium]|nr:TIGR03621 family F420-dependent LLM class oxidoreductase [Ktedonobacteraceae bacterium]
MQLHRPFRFGVVTHNSGASLDALVARACLAERLGYSTFLIPDHLNDQFDTALALALVAQATNTLRIGSFVFANDFRHPALLARIAATLDVISGGRFELGLGAGWMQSEYEQIGLSFDPPCERIDRMVEALQVIKSLFSSDPVTFAGIHYQITGMRGLPSPLQFPRPPIVVGGSGKRILSVAAREADIVSILPRGMVEPGSQRIDLADASAASVARKVTWIQEAAAERLLDLELNLFIVDMVLSDWRGEGADRLAHRFALSREQVMETPHLLAGTVDQVSEQLQK